MTDGILDLGDRDCVARPVLVDGHAMIVAIVSAALAALIGSVLKV